MTKTPDPKTQKRVARLMAVQGVYAMLADKKAAEELIPAYLAHYSGMDVDGDALEKPDSDLFRALIEGVEAHQADLEGKIQAAVSARTIPLTKNKDPLLYSILLCGSYEITQRAQTDIPLIINDYLHVSHGFFDGQEPKFVNGVLDAIAKTVN